MKRRAVMLTLVSATICVLLPVIVFGAELSKSDAIKLLTSLHFKNFVVAAVVNGIGTPVAIGGQGISSPNVATVLGIGELDGKVERIETAFFYDKEIGWFFCALDTAKKVIHLWTLRGHTELTAKTP